MEEGSYWSTLASIALVVAALVQGGCVIASLWYVSDVTHKHKEEFDRMEKDDAVLQLDAKAKGGKDLIEACT
jgi:hypothetical protein